MDIPRNPKHHVPIVTKKQGHVPTWALIKEWEKLKKSSPEEYQKLKKSVLEHNELEYSEGRISKEEFDLRCKPWKD